MADTFFAGIPVDGSGTRLLDADMYGPQQQGGDIENISATGNLNVGNVLNFDEHAQHTWNGGAVRETSPQPVSDGPSAHSTALPVMEISAPAGTAPHLLDIFTPVTSGGGMPAQSLSFVPPVSVRIETLSAPATNGLNGANGSSGDSSTATISTSSSAHSESSTTTYDGASNSTTTIYNTTNTTENNSTTTINNTTTTNTSDGGGHEGSLIVIDGANIANDIGIIFNTTDNIVTHLADTLNATIANTLNTVLGPLNGSGGEICFPLAPVLAGVEHTAVAIVDKVVDLADGLAGDLVHTADGTLNATLGAVIGTVDQTAHTVGAILAGVTGGGDILVGSPSGVVHDVQATLAPVIGGIESLAAPLAADVTGSPAAAVGTVLSAASDLPEIVTNVIAPAIAGISGALGEGGGLDGSGLAILSGSVVGGVEFAVAPIVSDIVSNPAASVGAVVSGLGDLLGGVAGLATPIISEATGLSGVSGSGALSSVPVDIPLPTVESVPLTLPTLDGALNASSANAANPTTLMTNETHDAVTMLASISNMGSGDGGALFGALGSVLHTAAAAAAPVLADIHIDHSTHHGLL